MHDIRPFLKYQILSCKPCISAYVTVAQTTPKGQSTTASNDKGMSVTYICTTILCNNCRRKNFVALIFDSPRDIDKCKRKLQFSEGDDVRKQQQPRKKKRKLLKVSKDYTHDTDHVKTVACADVINALASTSYVVRDVSSMDGCLWMFNIRT